jgi:hypothetical protein
LKENYAEGGATKLHQDSMDKIDAMSKEKSVAERRVCDPMKWWNTTCFEDDE